MTTISYHFTPDVDTIPNLDNLQKYYFETFTKPPNFHDPLFFIQTIMPNQINQLLMSFGSLSLFPEPEYRERRIAPRSEHRAPVRQRRESEYREDREERHEHNHMAEVAGGIIIGAATLGILGGLMRK